jgi:hypothetical protein
MHLDCGHHTQTLLRRRQYMLSRWTTGTRSRWRWYLFIDSLDKNENPEECVMLFSNGSVRWCRCCPVMRTPHRWRRRRSRRNRKGSGDGDGDACAQQRNAVAAWGGRRLDCVPMRAAFFLAVSRVRFPLSRIRISPLFPSLLLLPINGASLRRPVDFGGPRDLYSRREATWLSSIRRIGNGRRGWHDLRGAVLIKRDPVDGESLLS